MPASGPPQHFGSHTKALPVRLMRAGVHAGVHAGVCASMLVPRVCFTSRPAGAALRLVLCLWGTRCNSLGVFSQVKVWFQNRRTKQKKDTTKDSDKRSSSTNESLATCNILRLLEQGRLLSGPAPPPNPLLGHPTHNGSLLSSPGGASSTSPGISSSTPPSSLPGGTFGLSLPSLGGAPPSPRLGVPPPHSLCFSMPLLGGAHHELTSAYGCGSSAFEPYMRLDRKEADLGGKKTVS